MSVTVPFALTGSLPLSIQLNGTPSASVDLFIQGEGCSVMTTVELDSTGKATIILPRASNCLGAGLIIHAKDDSGHEAGASSFRI